MGDLSHETSDREVTHLARQLSDAIERAAPEDRAELREFAKDLVAESTEHTVFPVDQPVVERKPPGFLSALLPFLVAGFFLLFVLPPVGVVFLLFGVGIAVWGAVQQIVTHGRTDAGAPDGSGEADASANGTAGIPPRGEADEQRA
jgi:hypothetical protein